jgi:hypothetical protein
MYRNQKNQLNPKIPVNLPAEFRNRVDITHAVVDLSNFDGNFSGKPADKMEFLKNVIMQMCPTATVSVVFSVCKDAPPVLPVGWIQIPFNREPGHGEPMTVDGTCSGLLVHAALYQGTILLVSGDGNKEPVSLLQIRAAVSSILSPEGTPAKFIVLGGKGRVNEFYTTQDPARVRVLYVQDCVAAAAPPVPAPGGAAAPKPGPGKGAAQGGAAAPKPGPGKGAAPGGAAAPKPGPGKGAAPGKGRGNKNPSMGLVTSTGLKF